MDLFWNGAALGLAVAAPVGAIGLLCIRRTLEAGFWAGFSGGVGTALADALYALAAGLGLAAVAGAWVEHPVFAVIGAAMLLWLAWLAWSAVPPDAAAPVDVRNLGATAAGTFVLTLANPATIVSFAALLPVLGLAADATASDAVVLALGVFAGSLAWWAVLAGGLCLVRARMTRYAIQLLNRLAALGIAGFAAALLWRNFGTAGLF